MLSRIVEEFENTRSPMTLADIGRRLRVEPTALDGMVGLLVRKGRLRRLGSGAPSCDDCGMRFACGHPSAGATMGACYELVDDGRASHPSRAKGVDARA